jgi:phospholipase C
VSFLGPKFLGEGSGSSADDHPRADIRAGQYFLNQVYEALSAGPLWPRTALVINYDEWGGFYDHVAHGVYDHTSVLEMIEWRWGLPALTVRDAAARNLAEVLDFSRPANLTAPRWDVPAAVGLPGRGVRRLRGLETTRRGRTVTGLVGQPLTAGPPMLGCRT